MAPAATRATQSAARRLAAGGVRVVRNLKVAPAEPDRGRSRGLRQSQSPRPATGDRRHHVPRACCGRSRGQGARNAGRRVRSVGGQARLAGVTPPRVWAQRDAAAGAQQHDAPEHRLALRACGPRLRRRATSQALQAPHERRGVATRRARPRRPLPRAARPQRRRRAARRRRRRGHGGHARRRARGRRVPAFRQLPQPVSAGMPVWRAPCYEAWQVANDDGPVS